MSDGDSDEGAAASVDDGPVAMICEENYRVVNDTADTDDDINCAICFEPFTTTGSHRVCCLKCGHLFGQRCIKKWFHQSGPGRVVSTCPTCKKKAKLTEIREHYCRGVKVIDTSELDEARKQRDVAREETKKLQLSMAILREKSDRTISELQTELQQLKSQMQVIEGSDVSSSYMAAVATNASTSDMPKARLSLIRKLDICRSGEARVMDYSSAMSIMVTSSKSSALHLFPGYGLVKIFPDIMRSSKYIPVHSQAIRDVKFTPTRDSLVLTASMDKTLKLSSMHSDSLVHCWKLEQPLWSCCWNTSAPHYVFAGTQTGKVFLYDTRMTALNEMDDGSQVPRHVDVFDCGNKGVIALQWINTANSMGLLVSMIDRVMFLEQTSPQEFQPHALLLNENRITSNAFHEATQHFLTSFGPSPKRQNVEHTLYSFAYGRPASDPIENAVRYSCNPLHSFSGNRLQFHMLRNALFNLPNNDALIASVYDETSSKLQVWNASTAQKVTDIKNEEKLLQISYFDWGNTRSALTSLSTHSLYFYDLSFD